MTIRLGGDHMSSISPWANRAFVLDPKKTSEFFSKKNSTATDMINRIERIKAKNRELTSIKMK